MSEPERTLWPRGGDVDPGADSIAAELASRIDAVPPAPGDAMDWASVAAGYEREARALGDHPAAAELLFEAGRIYEERLLDPGAALEYHRRAYALAPGLLPNLSAARRLAMDAGDDAFAAEVLEAEAAVTPGPGGAGLHLLRARLLSSLGREAEAHAARARAEELAPDAFATAEEAARAAAVAGDRPALAEAYLRCARAAGAAPLAAHYLSAAGGLFEEALGDVPRAAALALEAFARAPADPLLRAAARRHAERLGSLDELAAILRAEAETGAGPDTGATWQALARVEERLGRTDAAVAALERARVTRSADPVVLEDLARLREARGEWVEAAATLEALAAAHLARRDAGHLRETVAAKLRRSELEEERLGRVEEAVRCCREVVALDPRNRAALSALGRLCARVGDWDGLLATFEAEAAAARDPRDRAGRTFKAAEVLEERLDRPADAIALYREALRIDPALLPARGALQRLLERLGDFESLCELLDADLDQMVSAHERGAHLFRIARLREERLGDVAGAVTVYRRMLVLDPGSRVALPALAAALERLGRFDEAAATIGQEAALAGDPRRRVALLQRRAELLDEHGEDVERAREAWEEVRAAAPDHHLPALRALGRLHARAGRWDALAAMFRAEADAAADPDQAAELVLRIGDLAERKLGRTDDAIAAYHEVLTLAPAHLPALHALARLYRARGDDESLVEVLRAQAVARVAPAEQAAALAEAAAICEERLGDLNRASEAHEDALHALPGYAPSVRALERLHAAGGRREARAQLLRAALADPASADRAERLLTVARLAADGLGDAAAALEAADALGEAVPEHPAALLLELRLAGDPSRRVHARGGLTAVADAPSAAALLAAAAVDLRGAAGRRAALARAASLDPSDPALAPEEERRLREGGAPAALAAFCEARAGDASDRATRASWAVRAGEAWERAGAPDRALAAFQAALEASPSHLPALRAARALLARRGDWGGVRATLQVEGAALQDPHEAAAAWLEASAIAEARFADREGAAADCRHAAERDPASAAALARLEGLVAAADGGAREVAALLEARARAERDPARASGAWLSAARAELRGGERDAALAALDRALEAAPGSARALELRARLRAEAGRSADALEDLEACLAAGGDAGARVGLHLEAAALLHDALGDPARALPHVEAALDLAPERAEALERLARIHRSVGRSAAAAAALRRLTALPDLPRETLLEHLVALAGLEADGPGADPALALAACRRVLDLEPGHVGALALLVQLEERRGDLPGLAAALAAAAAAAREPAARAEAHLRAARLHLGPLRGRAKAIEHLRAAAEAAPEQEEPRALLAETCEETAPALALESHRALLSRDPLRAASWSALYRLFERARAHDRAYVAATMLRFLGAPLPGAGAERLLLEGDRQALPPPPPLPGGDWETLRAPGDRGPLSELVAIAGDVLAAAALAAAPERGAPVREDHPFRRVLGELARSLGAAEYELFGAPLGRLVVEPGLPSAVLVGPDLARRTTAREARFLLGRVAARLRARSALGDALAPAALGDAVAAAVRQVVPGYGGTGRPPEDLVRGIGKLLPRRARKALEEPARAVAALRPPPDLAAWRAAAAATADRAGLVLCGDLPTALTLLVRDERAGAPADLVAAVRERPDALALVAFAASEEHLVLRQRLRVAIA
jgi:cellulose synthase operon protein C